MVNFFHPNKTNTGSACSFNQNVKTGDIYATLIKQASYDAEKRIGGFAESRGNPEKHINIKLGATEVAAILDCIDRFRAFSTVHDNDKDKTLKSINFGLWLTKPTDPKEQPQPRGYSFSITCTSKEDSTQKNSFYIGLTFSEARLVREFLIYSLQRLFETTQKNFEQAIAQQNQTPVIAKDLI